MVSVCLLPQYIDHKDCLEIGVPYFTRNFTAGVSVCTSVSVVLMLTIHLDNGFILKNNSNEINRK